MFGANIYARDWQRHKEIRLSGCITSGLHILKQNVRKMVVNLEMQESQMVDMNVIIIKLFRPKICVGVSCNAH